MSSPMKMSLLAFISTVAAAPHYGHHSRFHKSSSGYGGVGTGSASGHAYPTGGWGSNSTGYYPTGTGTGVYNDGKTTTIDHTLYSTTTIVSTIYATLPASEGSPIGAEDVSTGAAGCGHETVYVTATNKVTVTVAGPSSVAEAASSSVVYEAPSYTPVYEAPSSVAAPVSSAPAYEAPSSVAAPASSAPVYEAPSSVVAPVSSAEESKTPAYEATPSSTLAQISVSLENKPVVQVSTPVPSATPSLSPSTGSYSGGKRGLAYNDVSLCGGFPNAAFAYNWAQTEGNNLPEGTQYVPMMHKVSDSTPEVWKANVKKAVAAGTTVVMGFNEPDHGEQANMLPKAACEQWNLYMDLKGEYPDLTILGPSVTNGFVEGAHPMGLPWLEAFYGFCPNAGDAVNIHFYDIPDGAVERFKTQVEKAYTMFNKKVWVTEFGLNPGSATTEQAAAFVKEVTAWMDTNDHVQGYAYFMVGTGENQLNSGTGLSPIGEVYAS
ncbi:glycoside hydrolase family 128 protein [Amniculicola lignicola CBS 123094]|uniref:Glycoside hydrolase family 128 protein n=1 Tax=Amniculicola lignicola CBS 123094 TaxID=1392246 RepID=A0A6A5WI00_9PLEO|nr:glycoside hydrolase family 128 protein [Amniculicola lignicola CBS 123094]